MIAAWLIILPAGILITRFGRITFKWFPYHRSVQIAGILFVLIGLILAVVYVQQQGDAHFSSTHERLGVALCVALLVQMVLGMVTHRLRNRTGNRMVGYVHIPLGLLIVALSVWEVHLGFEAWDEITVPNWASYLVYAWAAVLVILYAIGFRRIRQERETDRRLDNTAFSGDDKPQKDAYMRSDAVDTYLMTEQRQNEEHQYQAEHWHEANTRYPR